jgi:hypothetical protein
MNQPPFTFSNQIVGQPIAMTGQSWQPQVHFIAKQQKFYGISPDRAPLIFNNHAA